MGLKKDGVRVESALASILRAGGPPLGESENDSGRTRGASGESAENLSCFGWSGDRVEVLEVRQKTGRIAALRYGWMDFAEFDPSEGITLHGRGIKVTISGRNLNKEIRPQVRLFEGIVTRRVAWIRESERSEDLAAGESASVVAAITW